MDAILERKKAAATETLYRRVVDLRSLLRGVYGAEPARRLLGLGGKTADDPVALERQARQAVTRLLDTASALPSAAYTPTERDRQVWAQPVGDAAGVLASARASASLAGKERDAAAAERRRRGVLLQDEDRRRSTKTAAKPGAEEHGPADGVARAIAGRKDVWSPGETACRGPAAAEPAAGRILKAA